MPFAVAISSLDEQPLTICDVLHRPLLMTGSARFRSIAQSSTVSGRGVCWGGGEMEARIMALRVL